MHETTLAAQLLRRIERAARAEGAARVTAVRLRVGEFAGVEPELLRIGFLRLAAGTMAEGARLEVEPVPLEAECAECGLRWQREMWFSGLHRLFKLGGIIVELCKE